MTQQTAVYRAHGADGALLYIGMTDNPAVRFAAHAAKDRWAAVDRCTLDWYATREEAEAAERLAIRTEKPAWNIAVQDENGQWSGIGRPRWTPAPEAAADVQKVVEKYRQQQEMEAEYKQALADVVERHDDLTVAYLADQLGVERKTVYRHLGRKMT